MVEQLTKVWKNYKPKQLAIIFKEYAISKGLKQYRQGMKDYSNTYIASSSSGGSSWHKVSCFLQTDSARFGNENLLITLRKKAGDYLIIERKGIRAFEVDWSGLIHYDEGLMKDIVCEHTELFKTLGVESEVV